MRTHSITHMVAVGFYGSLVGSSLSSEDMRVLVTEEFQKLNPAFHLDLINELIKGCFSLGSHNQFPVLCNGLLPFVPKGNEEICARLRQTAEIFEKPNFDAGRARILWGIPEE